MYAQRDEKKAEQAAKEQLEKEKPGEKKVAEEPPRKKRRVQKFPSLTAQMKEDIQKGKWLTDEHIHLAQTLLRAQFPNINGLQCPLLSENDAFDAQPHEALQIHFVAGNHWVASSSFGQEVTVYDSKYSGKLHPSLIHQLARIYRSLQTDEDGDLMLQINVPTVQQQFGSCDCGLFAIAFALHLAMGDDPQHILFEQSQMRSHLLKCFQKRRWNHFHTRRSLQSKPRMHLFSHM